MTASDAESWARLRLVQGESSAEKWELVSSLGHTTLTVGSGADCTWVVREEGVRPLHFSLHWDGSTLRVADVYSAGDVRVDGALLTSQWRPLLGRVRIDFGNAAMVIETSTPAARTSEHPLDLGEPRSKSSSPPRKGVETLIGVAPLNKVGTPTPAAPLHGYVPGRSGSDAPPPSSGPAPGDAARAARAAASMKATLVGGMAVGETHTLPPGTMPPSIQVVDTTGSSSSASSAPPPGGGPKPNATLMGFSVADALRGAVGTQPSVQVGGTGALYEADQRTVQSYPPKAHSSAPPAAGAYAGGRRMTQQGHVVPPSSGRSEAPPPRSAPPPGPRINSAWQEGAGEESYGTAPLPGSLPGTDEAPRPESRAPRGAKQREFTERLSDIPTQMRDPTTFSSRRPTRGIPWRYVGVLLLTAVAYFAWLYLLDHL